MERGIFLKFKDLVYRQSGITLSDAKINLVANRIQKRIRQLGLSDSSEYFEVVESDLEGNELIQLIDAISTNVTYFYREEDHFEVLAKYCREWQRESRKEIKIWCAASSTGEEPYSIAMTVNENIDTSATKFRLLSTDISTRVLEHAVSGIYPESRCEGIPPKLLKKYFTRVEGDDECYYQANLALRQNLTFKRLNLSILPLPLNGSLDAIFCRNVMIYFDRPLREKLIAEYYRLLRPGGALFMGHSESLSWLKHPFIAAGSTVYQKQGS